MAAVIEGYTRDDPKYLSFLEDEFARRKLQDERIKREQPGGGSLDNTIVDKLDHITTSLQCMNMRLEDIETNQPARHQAAANPTPTQPLTPAGAPPLVSQSPPASQAGAQAGAGVPTAADLLTAPLTKALAQLSGDDESAPGYYLRPGTYSQSHLKCKSRNHTKMDTLDLMYGWICVADHLQNTGQNISRQYLLPLQLSLLQR